MRTRRPSAVRRRAGPVLAAGLLVVALVVVALLAVLDRVQVQTQQQLAGVSFGAPLDWVTQDQGLDPPLPYATRLLSPGEHPTTVVLVPLAVDVVVVAAVLATVLTAAGWIVRRARLRSRTRT